MVRGHRGQQMNILEGMKSWPERLKMQLPHDREDFPPDFSILKPHYFNLISTLRDFQFSTKASIFTLNVTLFYQRRHDSVQTHNGEEMFASLCE